MLKDIRETSDEEYWEDLRTRWASLLSYRYIGRNHSSMNNGPVDNTVTLRHDMRNAAGGLMVAPISIAAPEGGTGSDLVAVPNPVIHSCQILDPATDVKRIEVFRSESLKMGQRMGFSRSKIVDADNHDRVIAYTEGQGVSIGTPPEAIAEKKFDDQPILEIKDSPDLPPLWKVFGASRRDDGHWALPELSIELASPDAALHFMFLARGKVGPFRVDGEADAGAGDRVGVRMVIRDEGNDDRAVTSGSAVFGRVD
jgi:hypothetical protein